MSSPITLLIIDDDEDDRQFFMEVVEQINPSVISTQSSSGQEALHPLHNNIALPDAIFLDLNMPRLNGFQFLEQLKKNERTSAIPVIIYTTSKQKEDIEEAKRLGAAHYITKPSCTKDLIKEIEFVLKNILRNVENISVLN
jgi:CheY-like chemotaxis protein